MSRVTITEEAGQDVRALIGQMTEPQFREMIENTLADNGFSKMEVQKKFVVEDGKPRQAFTILFHPAPPRAFCED